MVCERVFSCSFARPSVLAFSMTREEIRLAALERLLHAISPWLSDEALADAAATLRSEMVAADDHQQRMVLNRALLLLANGTARFGSAPPAPWIAEALREAARK